MSYQLVPSSDQAYPYPPAQNDQLGPPYSFKRRRQPKHWLTLKYLATFAIIVVVGHYALLGAAPASSYSRYFRHLPSAADAMFAVAEQQASTILDQLDPAAGQPGTFFRDSYPIRSMLAFWELAEKEVEAKGLDTCQGQLSRELIEAYHRSQMAYCLPPGQGEAMQLVQANRSDANAATSVWCAPVHRDGFSKWWPYPAAPCLSTNARAVQDSERKFVAAGCSVTSEGSKLLVEMDRERFLGNDLARVDAMPTQCKEILNRTAIVIGRQDQWNPFHVAEDLITTLVTVFIMARAAPDLINRRVQLVFAEGFGMDSNHFTPLWDRIGAWAPRRLSLEPWAEDVCLTNTIHSVGAGASLLSAVDIGSPYSCASTITLAASHYYRHLFGLLPPSLLLPASDTRLRRPINVLWLSRAKLDSYAQKHNDWSQWRDVRHIQNEPDLIRRLKAGIAELCEAPGEFGGLGCVFENAQDVPESWSITSAETLAEDDPTPVRFASIDPTVHALETQVHYVGHATIVVSSHGGALGLSLFLPPGDSTIIELQVDTVRGNFHFQHMAAEMGHQYEMMHIEKEVKVDEVWSAVQRWILKHR